MAPRTPREIASEGFEDFDWDKDHDHPTPTGEAADALLEALTAEGWHLCREGQAVVDGEVRTLEEVPLRVDRQQAFVIVEESDG